MITITLTQKDIEKAGIQNSPTGRLIDELAFSVDQWTEEDLYSNNFEYEPNEPYNFDYEKDLFTKTKTLSDLHNVNEYCEAFSVEFISKITDDYDKKKSKLQIGAFIALNYPTEWNDLLKEYTDKLNEDRTDGHSKDYNEQLQKEIDWYWNDMRKEWLYGDYRDYAGVVREIAKYYTDDRDGGKYDEKTGDYTFYFDETCEQVDNWKNDGYKKNQYKRALLAFIKYYSNNQKEKQRAEREKRKEQREKEQAYKKEREQQAEQARRDMLLALKV